MTEPRLTSKVPAADMVYLVCKNHPTRRWYTKNMPGRTVFFHGEEGKEDHMGMIPSFRTAMKDLMAGKLERRDQPASFNPETVAALAEAYRKWEAQYGFECDCPTKDLILDPAYDEMPEVS